MSTLTHYAILGVKPDATEDEIKKAFRKAARHLHPDSVGGVELPQYLLVNEAYETLRDSQLRAAYDATLADPQSTSTTTTEQQTQAPEWGTEEPVQEWPDTPPPPPEPATWAPPPSEATARYRPARIWYAPAAVALFVLAGWSMVQIDLATRGELAAFYGWMAYIFTALSIHAARRRRLVRLVLYLLVLAYFFLMLLDLSIVHGSVIAVSLVAGGVFALRYFSLRARYSTAKRMPRRHAKKAFSWGRPGAMQEKIARAVYGVDSAQATWAHRTTAEQLERLSDIPGVRVFHSVHSRQSQTVVDHVITCGDRIAVVNSVAVDGYYAQWDGGRIKGRDQTVDNTLRDRVLEEFTYVTGADRVAAWVIVHSPDGQVHTSGGSSYVSVAGAEHGIAAVRDFLLGATDPRAVDLRITQHMHESLVVPAKVR